jgi:hypothetical protein
MLILLILMNHIVLVVINMCPNDIDKQMNHFQERKDNYHADKHPVNDMDQLNFKISINQKVKFQKNKRNRLINKYYKAILNSQLMFNAKYQPQSGQKKTGSRLEIILMLYSRCSQLIPIRSGVH